MSSKSESKKDKKAFTPVDSLSDVLPDGEDTNTFKVQQYVNKNGLSHFTPFLLSNTSSVDPTVSLEVYKHKLASRRPNHWKVSGSNPFVKYEGYTQGTMPPSFVTKYAIAIVDKTKKTINMFEPLFFPISASPVNLTQLNVLDLSAASIVSADAMDRKRIKTELGESFGSKRQKAKIKSREKNIIDVSAFSAAETASITESIDEKIKRRADSVSPSPSQGSIDQ